MLRTRILRPGLMVHMSSTLKGNVRYFTNTLEPEYTTTEGEQKSRWETEKTVKDPSEHERAVKARSAARSKVQCVCTQTDKFGLFCLQSQRAELDAAIQEARTIARDFNATSSYTKLAFNCQVGEIADNDLDAIRNINAEVRDLMETMAEGLQELDAEKVREAATKAKNVGAMLTPDAKERVQAAVDFARKSARELVKSAKVGAAEIDRVTIRRIEEARTAFLDLDDQGEVSDATQVARAVDFEDVPEVQAPVAPAQVRMFDFD